ncbi:transposase [Amycolatopsis sp. NPDC059021]|uniref:transposase n=1 Tax=Amycolatopsis sp. NPDC059021 TaxID=3346704 RepID=UPI0036726A65
MISVRDGGRDGALGELLAFRQEFYGCLALRADALFELVDAVLCTDGPVRSLVGLSLAPEFCHTYGRGKDEHRMIPGWPYSIVAALETGRTSWTAPLDAIRLAPGADVAVVTTAQIREVVERLVAAGQWRAGDPEILVVLDAGYDAPRIAHLLGDLPVQILGRMRSDRVLRRSTPARVYAPKGATARAWDRPHPRLTRRAAWLDHEGPLPIIEGTVIRLQVDHLPSGGVNKPVWLWWSGVDATIADVDRCWQAFLRRFDIEHTFRLLKQTLGWTAPKLRDPDAADRWTWIVLAAHTQLRLARHLTTDLRRPWERPDPTGQAHLGARPARVPEHPREDRLTSSRTETVPAGAGTTSRIKELHCRATLRRRTRPRDRRGLQPPGAPQEGDQTTANKLTTPQSGLLADCDDANQTPGRRLRCSRTHRGEPFLGRSARRGGGRRR